MSLSFDVKVFPLANPKGKLVAFASILFDEFLEVKDFKIFDGAKGLFVAAPAREGKDKDGATKYFDSVSFREERAEGEFSGPRQKELYDQIIQAYLATKTTGSRVTAAKKQQEISQDEEKPAKGKSPLGKRVMW